MPTLAFALPPQTAIASGRKSLAERAAAAEAAADTFAQEQGLDAWAARREAARRRREQLEEALAVKQAELQAYKAEWQQRSRGLQREKAAAAALTAELAGGRLGRFLGGRDVQCADTAWLPRLHLRWVFLAAIGSQACDV